MCTVEVNLVKSKIKTHKRLKKKKKKIKNLLIRHYKTCIYFQWGKKIQAADTSLTKNDMSDI